jgi:arsenate reductase
MKIYGLKACDTCRKALKALNGAELVDIRATPLSGDMLAQAHQQFGAALVNTRSTTWRGLSDEDRQKDPLELLAEHPALMKRPLVEKDGQLYLGWTKDVQAALGVG